MVKNKNVYIIGGGISGCLTAIELSKYKHLQIHLFEKEHDILTGPPFCHLHAGGMLYPIISIEESKQLLYDSLEFANFFHDCLERRPTIIAYNKNTKYNIKHLIFKCKIMKYYYSIWSQNNKNKLPLGSVDDYFETYTKQDISEKLQKNNFHDPYIKTFVKYLKNINDIQYPIISVNEYGINLNLVNAKIKSIIKNSSNILLYTNTNVSLDNFKDKKAIIINSTGYNINSINNISENKDYYLEIKSSWIIKNNINKTPFYFPEIAIIGERNTTNGMLQITPQNNNCFQIHCMKNDITLFPNGCVFSDKIKEFYNEFGNIIKTNKLDYEVITSRTLKAINEIQSFFNGFENCEIIMKPLWGIQRIPGMINSNRNWSLLKKDNYIEIYLVKGISGVSAAKKISSIIN